MVNYCLVSKCEHSYKNDCRLFGLPKDSKTLQKWGKLLRFRPYDIQQLNKGPKVCSCHFRDHNKENLPTIRLTGSKQFNFPSLSNQRKKRKPLAPIDENCETTSMDVVQNKRKRFAMHSMDLNIIHDHTYADIIIDDVHNVDQSPIEDHCPKEDLNQRVKIVEDENSLLRKQVDILTKQICNSNLTFEFKFIENSNEKVFLHTGLPSKAVFDILLKLLMRVPIKYYSWKVKKIPVKEQLLMTLMKLRMNLKHFDLAQRFGCCYATVTNVVRTWVLLMHEILFLQLMKTIPSRRKNKKCLPLAFQMLSDCRIVLDGTDMFCDTPLSMENQKAAFSGYKHHCTCKGLLGVAPNGFVTYASVLYPGSTSDKRIVQHCGIMNHLVPGDMILADKGFLIQDVLPYGVTLNIPPFLTTPQFTSQQVRQTELIARARVHIERSINKTKNFRILSYIPAEMYGIATELFQVK